MRLLELSLRNYRVFEEVDLELPARVIGIFGENGSGKSTLMEAVAYGLYGTARTDRKEIRTHGVLADAAVRLVFEHGGRQYEVRRTLKGKNHTAAAELLVGGVDLAVGVTEVNDEIRRMLRMDRQVFRASVYAEQKQLDAFSEVVAGKRKEMVLRLLGIQPVEVARTAARGEARAVRTDAERLAGALPDLVELEAALAAASAAAEAARALAATAAEALGEADARSSTATDAFAEADRVRQRVEKLAVEREGLDGHVAGLERRLTELDGRLKELREALEALPALEEEAAGLAGAVDRLAAARDAVRIGGELSATEAALEALPELDAGAALVGLQGATEAQRSAQAAAADGKAGAARAAEDLAAAEDALARADEADPSQPCPTCGRPLGEDFDEYRKHCRSQVTARRRAAKEAATAAKEAARALTAAQLSLDAATTEGERARTATEERGRLSARRVELSERLAPLVEPFGGRPPDLSVLEEEHRRAREVEVRVAELRAQRGHVEASARDRAAASEELTTRRARLVALDEEAAGLAFDPEEHERLRKERDEAAHLLTVARAEERSAADAAKDADRRVAEHEAERRRVDEIAAKAGELRDEALYLDKVATLLEGFRTYLYGRVVGGLSRDAEALFRELTNHEYDDLRVDPDTLAIEIADGDRYFPIDRFSGSETDLANLALRVAISAHLSRASGTDVGLLILDEVLASLDAERKDLFVRAMGTLAGRFHQVFVITHAEQVKDQFPASIEVRKVGRRRSTAVLV